MPYFPSSLQCPIFCLAEHWNHESNKDTLHEVCFFGESAGSRRVWRQGTVFDVGKEVQILCPVLVSEAEDGLDGLSLSLSV